MNDLGKVDDSHLFNINSVMLLVRAVGAILGIVIVIIGLSYAMRMFGLIFRAINNPESCRVFIQTWMSAIDNDELNIVISGTTYRGAQIIVYSILGGGCFILTWLSLGMITAGTKLISWTVGSQAHLKQIISQTLKSIKKTDNRHTN